MIPLKALAVLCSRTVEGRSGDRPWRGSKAATCQVTRGALIGRNGASRLILRAPIDKSSAAPVLLLLLIQPAQYQPLVSQYFPLSPLLFLNSQLKSYTGLRTTFTSIFLFFLSHIYIFIPALLCLRHTVQSQPVTRKYRHPSSPSHSPLDVYSSSPCSWLNFAMLTSARRRVLDGLNRRYIYGRVVC